MTEAQQWDLNGLEISAMAFETQATDAEARGDIEESERLRAEAQAHWAEMGRIAEQLTGEGL